jgi:hypothetical protein
MYEGVNIQVYVIYIITVIMESQKNTVISKEEKEKEDKIKQDLSNKVNNEAIQIVKNETDINIAMDALNEQINNGSLPLSFPINYYY